VSTFAVRREYIFKFSPKLKSMIPFSIQLSISFGVFIALLPFPPAKNIPIFFSSYFKPSFNAPVTVVVTPDECQSKPRTHPNA